VPASPLIFLVEDDDSVREAMTGLLRSTGYQVLAFGSAEAFLSARGLTQGACLVSDIQLPGLSGIDLKRRLDAEGARLPVVLVTARTEPALHARAHAAGAICVLTKPFTADALLACVAKGVAGEDSTSD
jgi:FixJ family two-component response regulator